MVAAARLTRGASSPERPVTRPARLNLNAGKSLPQPPHQPIPRPSSSPADNRGAPRLTTAAELLCRASSRPAAVAMRPRRRTDRARPRPRRPGDATSGIASLHWEIRLRLAQRTCRLACRAQWVRFRKPNPSPSHRPSRLDLIASLPRRPPALVRTTGTSNGTRPCARRRRRGPRVKPSPRSYVLSGTNLRAAA